MWLGESTFSGNYLCQCWWISSWEPLVYRSSQFAPHFYCFQCQFAVYYFVMLFQFEIRGCCPLRELNGFFEANCVLDRTIALEFVLYRKIYINLIYKNHLSSTFEGYFHRPNFINYLVLAPITSESYLKILLPHYFLHWSFISCLKPEYFMQKNLKLFSHLHNLR